MAPVVAMGCDPLHPFMPDFMSDVGQGGLTEGLLFPVAMCPHPRFGIT